MTCGQEGGELLADDVAHPGDVGAGVAVLELGGQPREGDQRDARQRGGPGVDVVGQSEVGDRQRTVIAPAGLDEDRLSEDGSGAAGAGDEDVRPADQLGEVVEGGRGAAVQLGEPAGPLGGAVGDRERADPGPGQGGCGETGHRAGADHDRRAIGEAPDVVGRTVQGGGDDRRGGVVDVGLGVRPLADAQRLLEEHVERRTDGSRGLPVTERLADLPEDLALTDHHRVEAGGDGEEVRHRGVVVVHVEVRQQLLGRDARTVAEQARDRLDGAVEPIHLGVGLAAVARGEDGGLGDVLGVGDVMSELHRGVVVEREPLQQRHRRGAVGDADDENAHAVATSSSSRRWCAW